jgi:mono/diheme cytochrome c family protein
MDATFWQRMHGGSTHLPIVLLPLSVAFDVVALRLREEAAKRAFHSAGMALASTGVMGGCAAVIAGLAMTHGNLLGGGEEKLHHLFVWPGFFLSVALVVGRFVWRRQTWPCSPCIYLAGMGLASVLMLGAGYWGGEMLLHAGSENPAISSALSENAHSAVLQGHDLFLMNCAHCHGDDARGTEEGPDLTRFHKSEARIASVVKNGIKGEMPGFGQKLTDADVKTLIRFVQSLNGRAT